jgi:hypothetical protein
MVIRMLYDSFFAAKFAFEVGGIYYRGVICGKVGASAVCFFPFVFALGGFFVFWFAIGFAPENFVYPCRYAAHYFAHCFSPSSKLINAYGLIYIIQINLFSCPE